MKPRSLEEKIQAYGSPVKMLRASSSGSYSFPLPPQFSSWPEEQTAWAKGVLLSDMGQHMGSVVYSGPDVKKLFTYLAGNSFDNMQKNVGKQFVFSREDGLLIGDGVVVALEDDVYETMSMPFNDSWIKYNIQKHGFNVTWEDDLPTGMNTTGRRFYRYQIQGPLALPFLEKVLGGPVPEVKFFHVGEFEIAGLKVRALSHTMSRKAGFELFGPRAEGPQVLQALRDAGREFGMRESGAISLPTNSFESGWLGLQVPALYTGDCMKEYREWVSEYSFEGFASLGGSFHSDNIDDYYVTAYDIGLGRLIKFDHDFIGRAALEKLSQEKPKRQKVWLRWNKEDTGRVLVDSLLGTGDQRPKILGTPYTTYSIYQNDELLIGDKTVGVSVMAGYTVNVGDWSSLAIIDSEYAVDGTEVEVVWGDHAENRPLAVNSHALVKIRATVSTKKLVD